ncbi:DUF2231 domain-containing protein [Flindersiella endophytica]
MFDTITGLPVHALIVHAAVVFLPLTVLTALAFALVPAWRWVVRWPLLVGAVISLGSAFVARESGQELFKNFGDAPPESIVTHADRGLLLFWFVLVFFVVAVAAVFLLGGKTRIAGGKDREGVAKPLQLVIVVLLVVASVGTGYQTIMTGDAGARAVWGQQ